MDFIFDMPLWMRVVGILVAIGLFALGSRLGK